VDGGLEIGQAELGVRVHREVDVGVTGEQLGGSGVDAGAGQRGDELAPQGVEVEDPPGGVLVRDARRLQVLPDGFGRYLI